MPITYWEATRLLRDYFATKAQYPVTAALTLTIGYMIRLSSPYNFKIRVTYPKLISCKVPSEITNMSSSVIKGKYKIMKMLWVIKEWNAEILKKNCWRSKDRKWDGNKDMS